MLNVDDLLRCIDDSSCNREPKLCPSRPCQLHAMAPCALCEPANARRAILRRPKTAQAVCRECFFLAFETEVHLTIMRNKLFRRGERVGVAASGGKGV